MNELERSGLETLQKMGFKCFGDLGHVQIMSVFSEAAVSSDENFEFDYFVLFEEICLVGEMSGISGENNVRKKYDRFLRNFEFLRSAPDFNFFEHFNIPSQCRHLFRQVKNVQAFFIADKHERFDIDMKDVKNVVVIYRSDWCTIESYAELIGKYAQQPFLKLVKAPLQIDIGKDLRFEIGENKLMYIPNKLAAKDVKIQADVFSFVAHPGDLLDIAEVFRRELMPVIAVTADSHYQRPLDFKKLEAMARLVADSNFMFPNSILVSLDSECSYSLEAEKLIIPMKYGAISVIDGQHRLFSYAYQSISDQLRKEANILVTALLFHTQIPNMVLRCSARTFIEINQEQKRITSDHINEIAYRVLGETNSRALAAQIILQCNQRNKKSLHGMFNSSQTTKGVFKAATAIVSLAPITNLTIIKSLSKANTKKKAQHRLGYENLFGKSIDELLDAETVITQGVVCLERYFGAVKKVFDQDWPDRNDQKNTKGTTLAYTKVFSAFIKLLDKLIHDGMNWEGIEQELSKIRNNIISKRKLPSDYQGIVFELGVPEIPDNRPSVSDTYKFLNENRSKATSMIEIQQLRAKRLS